MNYLVDTNILIRLVDRTQPLHPITRTAVRKLKASGHTLQITAQNCIEFWNVATRPKQRNGCGWTLSEAEKSLRVIEWLFPMLPDSPDTYAQWRQLVIQFRVSGVQVHDARLAAAMRVNSITNILTFNTADFKRYAPLGIIAVDPTTI